MVTRLTRSQRQEQTRAQLLDAALRVFLRRGFHGASLDEIAEEAGYTTGAVYSNFKGKDDLFLAVLDAEAHRRFPLHSVLMLDAPSIEEGLRASAREMAQYAREHPGWTGRVRGVLDPRVAAARAPGEGRRAARAAARHGGRAGRGVGHSLGGGVHPAGPGGRPRGLRDQPRPGAGGAAGRRHRDAGPVRGDVPGLCDGPDQGADPARGRPGRGGSHDHDHLDLDLAQPGRRLRALAGDQLARDGWSRDRLLELQGERLRALVAHAVAASPYYREVLGPDAASRRRAAVGSCRRCPRRR